MPQKILVVNMNYLGDALMTTPALAALRRACPDARIDTVAGVGGAVEVLRGNPDINAVIPRTGRKSGERCRQLYRLLREERYTEVIILPPLPAYALTAWLARTANRVGRAGRGMDFFLTRRQPVTATHMADAMRQTMPVAEENSPLRRLSVTLTAAERDAARRLLAEAGLKAKQPLLAVNAGTSATRVQKRWPAEHFAAALDALADVPSVLIGAGAEEAAIAERILSLAGRTRPINLVGRTGIKELAALLEQCNALLTADSGPMHLATAVGTPTVALFGSTDPAVTGPYDDVSRVLDKRLSCAPCNNHPTCEGRYDCMRQITPEEAALAVRDVLREARGRMLVLPTAH